MEISAFDAYTLKARYYPTVIVVAPLCLAVLSLVSGQFDLFESLGGAILSGLGFAFVLDQVGRDGGRIKQVELFRQWGGMPTTILLRHSDPTIEPPTKTRYHNFFKKKLPNVKMPTAEAEMQNPAVADEIYTSCAEYLKEATRDHAQFPLIFQENINYGFRRNLWGMKPAGLLISVVGTLSCSAALFIRGNDGASNSWIIPAVSTLISACLLAFWICRFTPVWVQMTAFAYARQLLCACDSIHLAGKK